MAITKTSKRVSGAAERPQRRRSGLKAPPLPPSCRPGRRSAAATAASGAPAAGPASNVRVVVRVRPENERERQGNHRTVVRPLDDHMLIFDPRQDSDDFYFQGVRQRCRDLTKRSSKDVQYIFDRVFHPHHTNQQLFESTTKDIVDTIIDGFNCSVFAYGSTGAGKTHTMLGTANEPGIIFLTVMELYMRIEKLADKKCTVDVSYVEVYNEAVKDLLSPGGSLELREDGQRAVVIAGLSLVRPDGPQHLMSILEAGNRNRTQHPTDMNAESSRSHAVFQVVLRQSDSASGLSADVRTSKLSLIDLAGSERGSATGHKGARFREGANINKSLLALGSCINALADGKKFVPYRDSKLTRLLKDSIGGNCKTVMVANVTPSSASYEDTHNTLKYANRAKAIKTRLHRNVVSVDFHVSQYAKIVEELKAENASLRAQLADATCPGGETTTPATAPPTAAAAEETAPAADYSALRAAEASRRQLLCQQLQLEAEQQQLRLRLHRLRVGVQRAQLLRPTVSGRSDRQQQRLQARLAASHPRLEEARAHLAEAEAAAVTEAERVPSGEQTLQVTAQLATQRKLDEVRVQAAHLEAVCRMQQMELAALDQLLTAAVSTAGQQHKVAKYMGFVTPQLEKQYEELLSLVDGHKEVAWVDLQPPPADSPGQPGYDVTTLLRLTGTSYTPVASVRHPIGGAVSAPAPVPAGACLSTPSRPRETAAAAVTPESAGTAVKQEVVVSPLPDLSGPSRLDSVQPPGDTTLGCGATEEALIGVQPRPPTPPLPADPVTKRELTDCQTAGHSPTVSPKQVTDYQVAGHSPTVSPKQEVTDYQTPGLSPTVSPKEVLTVCQDPSHSPTVSPKGMLTDREISGHSPCISPKQTAADCPAAVDVSSAAADDCSAAGSPPQPQRDRDVSELSVSVAQAPAGSPNTSAAGAAADRLLAATFSAAVALAVPTAAPTSPPAAAGYTTAGTDFNATWTSPPPDRCTPHSDSMRLSRQTLAGAEVSPAAAGLNVTFTSPEPAATPLQAHHLNETFTSPPSSAPLDAVSPNSSQNQRRPSPSVSLNTTLTLPAASNTVTEPAALGVTQVLGAPPAVSPDLNATQVLCAPAAADLSRTVTLSAASPAPQPKPHLPKFGASPIGSGAPALFAGLELPPTPEILRRVRTPLKARPPVASAVALDSTFSVGGTFRAPSADVGPAPAAGGGARTVAERAAMKPPGAGERGARATATVRGGPAQPLRGFLSSAPRLSAASPHQPQRSLSAQKARSLSRLNDPASSTRDENRQPARGRTTAPALSGSSAEKRSGIVSHVGKLGLGRNRTGGLLKSKSTSVLKPSNS